jgi:hypothetical protein
MGSVFNNNGDASFTIVQLHAEEVLRQFITLEGFNRNG